MKSQDLINYYMPILKNSGIETGYLDILLILQFVSGFSKEKIIIEKPFIDEKIKASFEILIKRRMKLEPIAYILGSKEFYGLNFQIDKSVLIPRPDSEILVEEALIYHKNWAKNNEDRKFRILDIGTGSACIIISLAKNIENSLCDAIDISEDAINIAKKNSRIYQLDHKINFHICDFANYSSTLKFDLIISNPPYIDIEAYKKLEKNVKDYEPKIALTDGGSGLFFYELIAKKAKENLSEKGKLILEFGIYQENSIMKIFEDERWIFDKISNDLSLIPRVICFSKN